MAKKKVTKRVTKKVESTISDREYGHLKIIAIDNGVGIKGYTREELQQVLIEEGHMKDPAEEIQYGDPTQHIPTAPENTGHGGGVVELGNSFVQPAEESVISEKSEVTGAAASGVQAPELIEEVKKKSSTSNGKGKKLLGEEDIKGLHVSQYTYLGMKKGKKLYKLLA